MRQEWSNCSGRTTVIVMMMRACILRCMFQNIPTKDARTTFISPKCNPLWGKILTTKLVGTLIMMERDLRIPGSDHLIVEIPDR